MSALYVHLFKAILPHFYKNFVLNDVIYSSILDLYLGVVGLCILQDF